MAKTALLNIQKFEVLNSVKFLSGDFHDLGGVDLGLFFSSFYLIFI